MNQMIYKRININKVLYITFTTTNFNSKSMKLLFKNAKNKEGRADGLAHPVPPLACRISELDGSG